MGAKFLTTAMEAKHSELVKNHQDVTFHIKYTDN